MDALQLAMEVNQAAMTISATSMAQAAWIFMQHYIPLIKGQKKNKKPTGQCASYVKDAIKDGGVRLKDWPGAAKKYDPYLEKYGFLKLSQIPLENYSPQKGDIVVFQPPKYEDSDPRPPEKRHEYGHIQMYNGEKWVSDFIQPKFWVNVDYKNYPSSYTIYRP